MRSALKKDKAWQKLPQKEVSGKTGQNQSRVKPFIRLIHNLFYKKLGVGAQQVVFALHAADQGLIPVIPYSPVPSRRNF